MYSAKIAGLALSWAGPEAGSWSLDPGASGVCRVLFFRLRSRETFASFGETRRSAFGAKAVGPGASGVGRVLFFGPGA